ncbi:MAG: hypothetical protein RL338_705 [Chloroflexota bacterium]
MSDGTVGRGRRRPMERIGDLLPDAARRLGLDEELRLARAAARWNAVVAERVPAASGDCRLVRLAGSEAHVEATHPIVAQELRLRERELVDALAATPGLGPVTVLRVTVRAG